MKIEIELIEEMLGTQNADKEIHREFIASKSADAAKIKEELAALPAEELVEKSMTVFAREEGNPIIWDYQIKGFFKDACGMLRRVPKTKSNTTKAYKKIIDGLIFVAPRKIALQLQEGEGLGNCQRPLRAQTPQGERISLANSESVPAGTKAIFNIELLDSTHEKLVREWLDYGKLRGLGQWRNSGKGRFTWKEIV